MSKPDSGSIPVHYLQDAASGMWRCVQTIVVLQNSMLRCDKKKTQNSGFLKTWVTSSTVLIKGAKGGFIVVDAIYF